MKWKIIKNVSESPSILDDKKTLFLSCLAKHLLPRNPSWLRYLMTIILPMKTNST